MNKRRRIGKIISIISLFIILLFLILEIILYYNYPTLTSIERFCFFPWFRIGQIIGAFGWVLGTYIEDGGGINP